MSYKKNIGGTDKWSRVAFGVVIAGIGCYLQNWIWGIVGVIIFGTGIFDWCLIYRLFGISTCKTKAVEKENESSEKIS